MSKPTDPISPAAGSPPTALRLWPGAALAILVVLWRFALPMVRESWSLVAFMGALVGSGLILIWWLFFSRAPWADRLIGLAAMVVALFAVPPLLHETMAQAGYGMLFRFFAIPTMAVALVVVVALTSSLPPLPRRALLAVGVLVACASWALVRFEGADGAFDAQLAMRWSPSAEDQLVAAGDPEIEVAAQASEVETGGWPGFRGPDRDSRVDGLRIATDWQETPPTELWRRPVGPGWSSFAVRGELLFTQEQRGDEEVVAAYRVRSGEPVWKHADDVRFWEAIGGAGPRATPTLHAGRVHALGATGILNVLDATTGELVWSRDTVADTGATIPTWGISGSPLIRGDVVYVAVSSALAAYRLEDGELLWKTSDHEGEGYSSPHLLRSPGGDQIVLLGAAGARAFEPTGGELLWSHDWSGAPIVQPAVAPNGDLLIGVSDRSGVRRLALSRTSGAWKAEERWTSIRLKPYFNDFVVHEGHAYGFDGRILACMELESGDRVWKGGRYGNGQLVLLADQDLLLVLSEEGDLVLVSATPDGFREIAKVPAIEGKTWNHPVIAGQVLLVRNGEEMAAFELPAAG
ncbi:MAG: alcohol dehydrogenase [Acidobacteria bacterium]|nr:MAG: alcohol dehydrogenase [Acidobacteriota bacterium]REK05909.1 MAG: alcohol dehydrogenase [Acidobacteriota bacterium]